MARPPNRRQFFSHSLRSLLEPLAEVLADHWGESDHVVRRHLRPPGAIPEPDFLDTCYRCGNCVEVCPANAIRLLPSRDEALNNTPVVDPDLAACVVCDDLACMSSCPSGALQQVRGPQHIRMGLAELQLEQCTRTHGTECRDCVDLCPLGPSAIRLDPQGVVEVQTGGCIGCGVCQLHCPPRPRAIVVRPL